jgi:hypothetical protein
MKSTSLIQLRITVQVAKPQKPWYIYLLFYRVWKGRGEVSLIAIFNLMKLISSHFKSKRLQHRLLVRSTTIYPSLREDEVNKISASNGGMYSTFKNEYKENAQVISL